MNRFASIALAWTQLLALCAVGAVGMLAVFALPYVLGYTPVAL